MRAMRLMAWARRACAARSASTRSRDSRPNDAVRRPPTSRARARSLARYHVMIGHPRSYLPVDLLTDVLPSADESISQPQQLQPRFAAPLEAHARSRHTLAALQGRWYGQYPASGIELVEAKFDTTTGARTRPQARRRSHGAPHRFTSPRSILPEQACSRAPSSRAISSSAPAVPRGRSPRRAATWSRVCGRGCTRRGGRRAASM